MNQTGPVCGGVSVRFEISNAFAFALSPRLKYPRCYLLNIHPMGGLKAGG